MIKEILQEILHSLINNNSLTEYQLDRLIQLIYHSYVVDQDLCSKEEKILLDAILYYYNNSLASKELTPHKELSNTDILKKLISYRNK